MRILVCTTEYPPTFSSGIGNVAYSVVEQLKNHGVECTICSPLNADIKLGNFRLIQYFGIAGLVHYWYAVSKYFKKSDYDIVWLQNPYFITYNPFPCCLITMHSTYYGISYHRVGNTFFLGMYYKITSIIERYCLGKISKTTIFTGVGKSVCDELEKIGIDKTRITYIPNGVDNRHFKPIADKKSVRQKFGISNDDIILLSVGRLTPAKQPKLLIEIFSQLEKKMSNLTLCIAGTGEIVDSIKRMKEDAGLQKVMFLGQVDHVSRLPDLYAGSDYFIITSKYEGGQPPLTLAEAMASGLPCIVSDIPQLNIVRDANCGIIVHFEDVEKAINQIYTYLTGIHQEHSKNARNYAVNTLDWKIIAIKYLNIFQEILKKDN